MPGLAGVAVMAIYHTSVDHDAGTHLLDRFFRMFTPLNKKEIEEIVGIQVNRDHPIVIDVKDDELVFRN